MACGVQFRGTTNVSSQELWDKYCLNKQTISELASEYHISESTVKRRLKEIDIPWEQPQISGSGYVHLDVTYWGRGWGVLLAQDSFNGKPLYVDFVENEKIQDYVNAVLSIEQRGYTIRGIIIDGKKGLFEALDKYPIQMCQFHMIQIVKRHLTLHPKLLAARELKDLVGALPQLSDREFEQQYQQWKEKWHETISRRSTLKSGKTQYTHKRLRTAMNSLNFYQSYLFTYQLPECVGMPNTNNKVEGTFTDLKKNLNNHSGMSEVSRKKFIYGFFLALEKKSNMK